MSGGGVVCFAVAVALWVSSLSLHAQVGALESSNRTLKVLVGYPAGGPVDTLARRYAPRLAQKTGRVVMVDNHAGASGVIAADLLVKSSADGYPLLLAPVTLAIIAGLKKHLPFDPELDIVPLAWIANAPFVLVASPSLGVNSVFELIARANTPGVEVNFASASVGGIPHLAGEIFNAMAGLNMVHIPYKGAAPATSDLLAGQVNLMFDSLVSALPYIKSKRLVALGVTGKKRLTLAPDIPSISEFLPNYEAIGWYGFFVNKNTDSKTLVKLNALINEVTLLPEVDAALRSDGLEPVVASSAVFKRYYLAEMVKWSDTIKRAHITDD
jgi:tripartite-type tricarboxylate transporter receptor subunit TctC